MIVSQYKKLAKLILRSEINKKMNYNQLIRDERLMAVYVTYETGVV